MKLLTRPPVEDPLLATIDELESFRTLEPDWDSYGAPPIASRAIRAAQCFLRAVAAPRFASYGERRLPYTVAPLGTGGVQMEWRGPGGAVELEVGPTGDLTYLLIRGGGDERTFVEGRATQAEVLRMLASILG